MADTEYTVDVGVTSNSAVSAAEAVARLAANLELGAEAAKAANQAVTQAEASYRAAESAADRSAKALERINLQLTQQKAKLDAASSAGDVGAVERASAAVARLSSRQAEASANAARAASALADEARTLDRLSAGAKQAEDAMKGGNAALKDAKIAAAGAEKAQAALSGSGKVNEAAEAFGKLGGPLGMVGQRVFGAADGVKKLYGSLGSGAVPAVAAIGIAAVAAAVLALAVATVVGLVKIAAWSVGLADAARSARLLADGVAGSVASGGKLNDEIERLQGVVPLTRDELLAMAGDLKKGGKSGDDLAKSLGEAAVKAATLKFGPNFGKQLLGLDSQAARFKRNIGGLFGGLNIEPALEGLAKLVGLFDSTSSTGKAIKVVFESFFQPLLDGATAMVPKVISGFIQVQIWILKALIAIKPFGSTFMLLGEIALGVGLAIISPFIGLAAVIALVAVAVVGMTKFFLDAYDGAMSLGNTASEAFTEIYKRASEMYDYISGLSLEEIGGMLIQGLADGITNAAGSVIKAITGVANGALDAAKSVLQIASPSKAAFRLGGYTGEGMADGIDDQKSNVQSSMESLSELPDPSATGGAGAGSSKGGYSVNLAGATITFHGVKDAQTAIANFGDMLLKSLEGDVSQLAGAVPNG